MNISDEAVIAGARALFEDNYAATEREVWDVPAIKDHYLHIARTVLETAAPSLMHDAWQLGNDTCWSSSNPYRKDKP